VLADGGYPLYQNDTLADCTLAATAHLFLTQAGAERRSISISEADVVSTYRALSDGKDDGLVETDVLEYARTRGLAGNHWDEWVAIDPKKHDEVKACAALFCGVYMGAELPVNAQSQLLWDAAASVDGDAAPGSWGGHAMAVVGYDDSGVSFATWGAVKQATWAWWDAYVDECYVCLDADRQFVRDFVDWSTLQAELRSASRT
jgi:hypothetical protein